MAIDRDQLSVRSVSAGEHISNRFGNVWWLFFIRGLLALMLGIAALFWPDKTLALLVRLVGFFALLDGVTSLISMMRTRETGSYLTSGLISLAVGLVLLFWPGVTVKLMMIILGVWALFQGVSLFLAARQSSVDDPDRSLLFTIGAIAALIGIVLIAWPATGAVTISWIIAAIAFIASALLISLSLRLRRINQKVSKLISR